MPHFFMKLASN